MSIMDELAQGMGFDDVADLHCMINKLQNAVSAKVFDDWKRNKQTKQSLLEILGINVTYH